MIAYTVFMHHSGITKPRGRLDYEGFGVAFWSCMASMCILWVCFIVAVMDYVLKNCTNGRFGVKGRTKDPESSADGMELGKPTTMSVHAYPSSEYSCSAYEQSVAHQMSQLAQQQNVLQQQLMLQQQQLNMAKPPVPVMVGGPSGWDTVSTGSGHPSQHQQYGQAAYNGMDARKFSTYSMPSPTGQNGTAQRTSLSTMPTMDGYQPTPTTTMYSGPESASAVEKEACVTELDEIEAQLREMVDDFNKQ